MIPRPGWPFCLRLVLSAMALGIVSGCTVGPQGVRFGYTPYAKVSRFGGAPYGGYAKRYTRRRLARAARSVPDHQAVSVLAMRAPPASASLSGYGFAGRPVRYGSPVELGTSESRSLFAGLLFAHAAQPVKLNACILAAPHPALASETPLEVAGSLPGFYGAPWTGRAGRSLIALLHVYAPRDAALPVPGPDIRLYKNYFSGNRGHATFSRRATASVYQGSRAVLYRVFIGGPILGDSVLGNPVQCIDLIVPRNSSLGTGHVYYRRGRSIMESTIAFKLVK